MPINRYFLDTSLVKGQAVSLSGGELHHLVRVTRKRADQPLELVNGRGQLAQARITSVTKDQVTLEIHEVSSQAPPRSELILAQAICRPNRLALILEKGTELGVTSFWLFPAERSERESVSLERAKAICIAALKQSGRLYLPTLVLASPIAAWDAVCAPTFFGSLSLEALPLTSQSAGSRTMMVIGPESGLSDAEIQHLAGLGALGVRLNRHTLRTDTAAIVSVGMLTQMEANR